MLVVLHVQINILYFCQVWRYHDEMLWLVICTFIDNDKNYLFTVLSRLKYEVDMFPLEKLDSKFTSIKGNCVSSLWWVLIMDFSIIRATNDLRQGANQCMLQVSWSGAKSVLNLKRHPWCKESSESDIAAAMNFFVNILITQNPIKMLSNSLSGEAVACSYAIVSPNFMRNFVTANGGWSSLIWTMQRRCVSHAWLELEVLGGKLECS